MMEANTIFLRLEGPLQVWGDTSKFVVRRTMEAPTKSGVMGLITCAMGLTRRAARGLLSDLNGLVMGVRIDRPGMRWWDYHSVGAGVGMSTAGGGLKTGPQGTLITRREYLSDASFLVALQGDPKLVQEIAVALASPKWPVFLGRRSCPPGIPIFSGAGEDESWTNPMNCDSLNSALSGIPWRPRHESNPCPIDGQVQTIEEWQPGGEGDLAPDDAQVWYDVAVSFDPPVHRPRFVLRRTVSPIQGKALLGPPSAVPRPRADYANSEYQERRKERIAMDGGLCVFCKSPGPRMTVQHVTYRRAGGNETLDDLRSLCGLCHDAVTMIEYGLGMGMDRINPEDRRWRSLIIQKRAEILRFRSLQTRRRRLAAEEVE